MTQAEYILILFNECGIDTLNQRAAFMSREFDRPVRYSDELTSEEKSRLISTLKDVKAGQDDRLRSLWRKDADS